MSVLFRLMPYLKPQIAVIGAAYLSMVILNVTTVIYAALMGPALEFVFTGDFRDILRENNGELRDIWTWAPPDLLATIESLDPSESLWVLPAIVVTIAAIKGVGQTGQFFLFGRVSQHALRALRQDAFESMLAQPPSFYAHRAHGDLLSRLSHDAGLVEQAVFYGIGSLLRDTLAVVGLLAYVFWSDASLALWTFVTVPIAVLPIARFTKWLKKVSKRGQNAQGDINAVSYEALAGVRVVQAFGNEAKEAARLGSAADRYYGQMLVSYFIRAVRTPTMEVLGAAALGGLVALLSYQVQAKGADPAHYISFIGAIFLMYDPLKRLGRVSDYLAAGASAAERIFEVVDIVPEIRDAPNASALPPFSESVVLNGVSFAYGDGSPEVLADVSLELTSGHIVALVGPSGSGKTTLANLLPRFYDVAAGSIAIDGKNIKDVTLRSLRSQIAVVSQETFLFNASVYDNIAYGTDNPSTEAVQEAAKAAYAHDFVTALPEGYQTVIGERGVKLSGGQRQRLAIARALLRDTPLLILDEATSALDVESERYVQRALERLMQGRTTLVIAHRLSTVRRADTIVVLKDGRVIERGDHEELLAEAGEYARLYELQFKELDAETEDVSVEHNTAAASNEDA